MKKVLLIGADGMLGGELKERLEKDYEVYGTTLETLDITDKEAVMAKAKEVNPYFIINCAAYTNVDGCEVNEDLAKAVNGTAVGNISEAAKAVWPGYHHGHPRPGRHRRDVRRDHRHVRRPDLRARHRGGDLLQP